MSRRDPDVWHEATADGQVFRFLDSGVGPLVVLLHGFPDVPESWDAVRRRLNAEGFRTVVPYLRGYHPVTFSDRGFRTTDLADDLALLLDALGEPDAMGVGHDWGAHIAYAAATKHPDRLTKIVTVGIPHAYTAKLTPAAVVGARHFAQFKLPWAGLSARAFGLRFVDRLYRRWSPRWEGPVREQSVAEAVHLLRNKRVLRHALCYYKALNPVDPMFRAKIAVPALVVGGSDDPPIFQRAYALTPRRFVAPCDVVVLEGAGHWPHREREEAFLETVIPFLER